MYRGGELVFTNSPKEGWVTTRTPQLVTFYATMSQGTKYNIRQTTLGQYVADLKAGNKRAKNSYMAVQNIKKALPQLQEDVIVPDYVGKMHGGPYMWIARKGHYEYCHTDADDGFLVILSGQKQARLFGCEVEPLYPNPKGTKGRTLQSQVDCDNPDLTKHPLFSTVTCHHCLLNQGDMLYIPAFWWHQITSTEMTISVNIFWGNRGTNDYLSKVLAPPLWPVFSHWLLNIIEQNRQYASFSKILSRLPEAFRHFFINQWHEEATPDQLDTLVTLVMDYLGLDTLPPSCCSGKHPPPLQIRGLLWRS
ncbi:hypothetical protein NP493_225g01040 [Ridgeia piscesae]|uniref:JmjC domain-containing protein n=1 Tax=Ridgeia piscesae TaxID=27915 RepID=A0AAD9UDV8_RIDPI|nr:hypothetical protein NP493_225g01040 [Ridgeia piscesae]